MAEDSALYWALFQGEFPEEWRNDSDFLQYLSALGAYSVEKLQLEPDHLREERRLVLNSTQKLAFNNYQTFIETAECTREIFKDFVSVEQHVSKLLEKIPGFISAAKKFTEDTQDVNSKRKLNSLALSRHTQLLEVLEIPQVMETCVRNGYYEEALDLSAHVRRMDKKHGSIPIVKAIAQDVEASMDLMLTQLLQQLRGSIQLPSCLRVVGFLRRMEVFSDVELRLKFLQARDSWLQSVLSAIPAEDSYHHLSKVVEASRVHLFDIVTQYRAIFPDDDTALVGGYSATSRGEGMDGALFYSWVGEKIWQFLKVLESDLLRGVGGRMDSLLSQCMYFGLSFSRIGADFRPLIAPVFVRVIIRNFRHAVRNAKHSFHESMKKLTLLTPLRNIPSSSSSSSSSLSAPVPTSTQSLTPPHSLLDFPPLSTLTNTFIAAFNDLRQCSPLVLGPEISQELQRLLESVVHDVGEYHRVEHASFTEREAETYRQLCQVVVQDFLPFVKKCFQALFAASSVQRVALTTPYALKHLRKPKKREEGRGWGEGDPRLAIHSSFNLDLKMDLDVKAIGEALRPFAPEVFEEMERQTSLSMLSLGVEELMVGVAKGQEELPAAQSPQKETTGGELASAVEPSGLAGTSKPQSISGEVSSPGLEPPILTGATEVQAPLAPVSAQPPGADGDASTSTRELSKLQSGATGLGEAVGGQWGSPLGGNRDSGLAPGSPSPARQPSDGWTEFS